MIFKDKDDAESDELQAGVKDSILKMLRSREKTIISGDEHKSMTDYLTLLLKAHHESDDNYKLSMQDIIDDCKTFTLQAMERSLFCSPGLLF
ncbi:putative 11-oxo-beta-amyrin 30-oxidase [Helianthus annuus]|nr:putative 11-oxo-beta-amyrin 30-oxidase [Helianthus annuus]